MGAQALTLLLLDVPVLLRDALAARGFACTSPTETGTASAPDAILCCAADHHALAALQHRADLLPAAFDTAVLVLTAQPDDALEAVLLQRGVQDVRLVGAGGAEEVDALARAIRHAVLRKQAERSSRTAYATDLATGLPHRAQLLEHMSQLLALREREPAPMVLIVLRVQARAGAPELGAEAGNILRRKLAVRLRSQLRASDVVAAIAPDVFGVLLGRLVAPADGQRVLSKLVRALQQTVVVAGQTCSVVAEAGLALYPEHGKDAQSLLQRAAAQAGAAADGSLRSRLGAEPAANDDAG